MGDEQELQAFAELYGINIDVYDRMTSSTPMYHISSGLNTSRTVRLFFTGNYFDSLLFRDNEDVVQLCKKKIQKLKKAKFSCKEEYKLINRKKDDRFINEYSTASANQYFRLIAEY